MSSPFRCYRTFVDGDGVRWSVEVRLVGEGADTIPLGFSFASQAGEQRTLVGSTLEFLSWEQFRDAEWCELLRASRVVQPAATRGAHRRYAATQYAGRRS